jgi:hypothetical protein
MRHCDGKQRFETYRLAEEVAKRSRRRRESNRHVYRCRHCDGFHIGSQIGRREHRPRMEFA